MEPYSIRLLFGKLAQLWYNKWLSRSSGIKMKIFIFYFYFWVSGEYNKLIISRFRKKWMVECYASKLQLMRIDLYQVINYSLLIVLTLLIKIVKAQFHSRFLPEVFKVPLSPLSYNDIALREDNALICGVMLPVK